MLKFGGKIKAEAINPANSIGAAAIAANLTLRVQNW